MHLQENTLFDLDLDVKVSQNVAQYPLHHVIYAPVKFEADTSNSLGEDGFTRKHIILPFTGPRSAVGNVSGYRCVSDCRSRGREFDPGPVPYFHGD